MNKVYDIVTDQIINLLEQGVVPWNKPWNTAGGESFHKNLVSKKPYRGINAFILNCSPYNSPFWVSFNQCKKMGGHVKKGEKSTIVVFWKMSQAKRTVKDENGNDTEKVEMMPILRYYRVFNIEQIEGIDEKKIPAIDDKVEEKEFTPIELCESIIENMPNRPPVFYRGVRACYYPGLDRVDMPERKRFESAEGFYNTFFHELAHSTKHESRLNRKDPTGQTRHYFGDPVYSREELVAEMTSTFLCGVTGIAPRTIENSAAYIKSWLRVLKSKDNKKMVVVAAAQAQKAADYIQNIQPARV